MSNNEKKLTPYQQKEIEKINEAAEIRKKAEDELHANAAVKEFLTRFNPESVKRFIDHYLDTKTICHQHGEFYLKHKEDHDLVWIEAANEHLANIQQKKLFDLQCLWRADKIKLPGVDICFDFQILERDILNCTFLDPVSLEEVEMYKEYLLSENADIENELRYSFVNWQMYDDLKFAYESGNARCNFPEWYDFYNSRRGTGVYMSLPDIRGEKEQEYIRLGLGLDPQREKALKAIQDVFDNPGKPRTDKKGLPYLNEFDSEMTDYFVSTFEDKLTKKYYKAYKWFIKDESDEEDILEIIDMFLKSGEQIPVQENADWKEAMYKASRKFKAARIVEAMDYAFDQYLLTLNMGIGFAKKEHFMSLEATRKTLINDILKGRKLKGEPENLDF